MTDTNNDDAINEFASEQARPSRARQEAAPPGPPPADRVEPPPPDPVPPAAAEPPAPAPPRVTPPAATRERRAYRRRDYVDASVVTPVKSAPTFDQFDAPLTADQFNAVADDWFDPAADAPLNYGSGDSWDSVATDRLGVFAPGEAGSYGPATYVRSPFETGGRVKFMAAVATIAMLGIMYVSLVQQRASLSVSIPGAPIQVDRDPVLDQTPEPPPVVTDEPVTEVPTIPRPPALFDDPFGLTRGMTPSVLPPELVAIPPSSAPPPPPLNAPINPPLNPVAAVNETPTPAPAPASAPPPPPARSPAPARAEASPPVVAPAARAAAPTNVPPPVVPAVAAPPPAPPAAAPASAAAVVDSNTKSIQTTLTRYQQAFSMLDAGAARRIWPTVDERTLSRAFERLEEQQISFEGCMIDVNNNERAEARCNGYARYVPRVGSRTPRVDQRQWRFSLVKSHDQWLIGAVEAR